MNWAETKWIAVTACAVGAAALGWRKTDGWGWFLFVGLLIALSSTT